MEFNEVKYQCLKDEIQEYRDMGKTWDEIAKLDILKEMPPELYLQFTIARKQFVSEEEFTLSDWEKLVRTMQKAEEAITVVKLAETARNDAKIPTGSSTQWQRYKKNLKKKGFSDKSILEIQNSAHEILQQLDKDTIENKPVKGLVMGNVQSGKTANMAGLISMAADYGFNYFIIFSGIIENLRHQTANRMYEDLNISSVHNWKMITNPSVISREPENQWENIDLSENSKSRYFTVCLKQKDRMERLIKWLYNDKHKIKQLKVLVIDDEADQASINTKKEEEYSRTAINKSMLKLVNGFKDKKVHAMNYISYTATPFANVLNESSEESLYPSNFIFTLNPSDDYIGPKQIFGLSDPESYPDVDIVRPIPKHDVKRIIALHDGKGDELPESFKKAIDWFFVASAAMRSIELKKPITMLVHTSQKKAHHAIIADAIQTYLLEIKKDKSNYIQKLKELYIAESVTFRRQDFLDGMPEYSAKDKVPDYPDWEEVVKQVIMVLNQIDEEYVSHIPLDKDGVPDYHRGFHLVVDNSDNNTPIDNQIVRLVYPTKTSRINFASLFIVIGGNTLSRGLTLEGLTTSYFLRTTALADTLMQMGRWFGYRHGYEVFPRVWLNSLAQERFEFLSQMNEELREEIKGMAKRGQTPRDWAPRIKNSPSRAFLQVTSANKMQAAQETDLDFTGWNKQTVVFKNEPDKLRENFRLTADFLNNLTEPVVKDSGQMVWGDVDFDSVKNYLKNFEFTGDEPAFKNIEAFLQWYEEAVVEAGFVKWSVILSSNPSIPEAEQDSPWNIHGYSPGAVLRTRRKFADGDEASIGVLRSPQDLTADIPDLTIEESKTANMDEVRKIRAKHGFSKVPQLLLYRIDKGQMTKAELIKKSPRSKDRFPLKFDEDVIGMNIMIPGVTSSTNLAKTVSIRLPKDNQEF